MDKVNVVTFFVFGVLLSLPPAVQLLEKREDLLRIGKWIVFCVYLFGFLYETILFRAVRSHPILVLEPLWSYRAAFSTGGGVRNLLDSLLHGTAQISVTNSGLAREILLNILLCVPLGYLLPFVFPDLQKDRLLSWQVVLIGFLLSVCTETVQYLFRLGTSEVDDVINNTLGCLIGSFFYGLIALRAAKKERRFRVRLLVNLLLTMTAAWMFALCLQTLQVGVSDWEKRYPFQDETVSDKWMIQRFGQPDELSRETVQVIPLGDGHLAGVTGWMQIEAHAASLERLSGILEDMNIPLLYTVLPCKINQWTDQDFPEGKDDWSNENQNRLLQATEELWEDGRGKARSLLDLREVFQEQGIYHHDMFYKTDYFWKPRLSLLSSAEILTRLKDMGIETNPDMLEENRWAGTVYPGAFFGSRGKIYTREKAQPEDFEILEPDYPTAIRYQVPGRQVDESGDFSLTMLSDVLRGDTTQRNLYAVYGGGDEAEIRIVNELSDNRTRLLVLHDSFGNCAVPQLAMGVREVRALDLRLFDGSLETYLRAYRPTAVVIMYIPSSIKYMRWTGHSNLYDFR
ncbi:MAG: VanZ family protein [Clostridia bacterium]|nr:VanZ family protein [Clostridia bacterium]